MLYCWTLHLPLMSLLLSLTRTLPLYQPVPTKNQFYNPEENFGVNIFLTEGDILVDRRRSLESTYYKTWYNRSVPYTFDQTFNADKKLQVEAAMRDIQDHTCIRFKERVNEKDYLLFTIPVQGCYSAVGRRGGMQYVSIADVCFVYGIILHEILHALGLYHEQNRQDRDEYIKVIWDNIYLENQINFQKHTFAESDDLFLNMPYDYGSVMHYANNSWAIDRHKLTLEPLQELGRGVVMGQRVGLSQGDIDKLNALYRCDITNCSDPGTLTNGQVLGTNFSVGFKVQYSCNAGYTLVGAPERECDLGEWFGDPPTCLPSGPRTPLQYCNFDDYTSRWCGWTQASDEELNWTLRSGPTLTEDTGPNWDHTLRTGYGNYVYVESSGTILKQKARLVSPPLNISVSRACLVFFTHMHGKTMGNLTAYATAPGSLGLTDNDVLISLRGDLGQQWRQVFVALDPTIRPFVITFEGSVGSGVYSDIAIDDIVIGDCNTFKPLALAGGLPETVECSFDRDLCDFQQDKRDDIDWDFNIGRTATFETGPDCDPHDCQNGQYLYIESSRPRVMGNRGRLKTPVIGGVGTRCLTFYYHMYGDHIGSLTVKMTSALSGSENILWTASGNQGNRWHSQYVDFMAMEAYEISFDGTVGPSYKGDIAIDSISVTLGRCTESLQFDCGFEHDLCGWMNAPVPGDTLDWVRHTGETDSPNTGPTSDRNSPDGYYLYVESSRTTIGDSARLVSPTVRGSPNGYCLLFWYHMYGQSSGNLTVSWQTDIGREEILWALSGDQGNQWRSRYVNITNAGGRDFNIIFEATMFGFTGDVAIDDISIQNSLCGN